MTDPDHDEAQEAIDKINEELGTDYEVLEDED